MVNNTTERIIDNVFSELNVAFVDDNTYEILEKMISQYEYIDNDLLKQMIEAELIVMLDIEN
jgi:hypothetical protein